MDGFSADTDKPTGMCMADQLALATDRVRTTIALATTRLVKRESREAAAKRVAEWRARMRGIGGPTEQRDRRESDARAAARSRTEDTRL